MRHFRIYLLTVLIAGSPASFVFAQDFSSTNFTVKDPVIAEPAGYGTSSNYGLWGTIPNIDPIVGTSTSFGVNPGFLAFSNITMPILSATAASTNTLNLSWTASVGPSPVTYEPGYATTLGGPYTFGATQTIRTATVSGLTANTPYYLIIRVKEQVGATLLGYSNELAISTLAETPAAEEEETTSGSQAFSTPPRVPAGWILTPEGLVPAVGKPGPVLLPGDSVTVAPPLLRQFGYVVEVKRDVEVPIIKGEIQLWRFNTDKDVFELWPNKETGITLTDEFGLYSFMIPPGLYQLRAEVPGYLPYFGPAINVKETGTLEQRIELIRKPTVAIPWFLLMTLLLVCLALIILTVFLMSRHLSRRS